MSNPVRPSMLQLDTQRIGPATFRVPTDRSFWNYTSAFGGWVAALTVRLVQSSDEFRGEVLTQQMQFVRPIDTDHIDVTIELLARRSSIDFWRVRVEDSAGDVFVTAELTAGERRETGIGFEAPGWSGALDDSELMPVDEMRPIWMSNFEQRMIQGTPFTVAERPWSVAHIRPRTAVDFDASVLAMVCDTPMPRTFFASTELVFGATLSLSTHVYATDEELRAVGDDGVIVEADSAVIRNNLLNQEARVSRVDGLLLATSYQTAVFRPLA